MSAHDTGGDRAPGDVLLVHGVFSSSLPVEMIANLANNTQKENMNETDTFVRFPIPSNDPNDPLVRRATSRLHTLQGVIINATTYRTGASGARCSILGL